MIRIKGSWIFLIGILISSGCAINNTPKPVPTKKVEGKQQAKPSTEMGLVNVRHPLTKFIIPRSEDTEIYEPQGYIPVGMRFVSKYGKVQLKKAF